MLQELKNSLRKLAVAVNNGGHPIRDLTERSASDGGILCPLWFVIIESICYSVEDAFNISAIQLAVSCSELTLLAAVP